MAGLLNAHGFQITDNKTDANVWVLNSCTVKNPAEDHFKNELDAGRKAGKSLVLAGCVPQAAPKDPFIKGLSIIGVQQIDRIVEVVEETLQGNTVRILGQKKAGKTKLGGADLTLPKIRRNPLIEIIAISTGCLNQCTYCKTKFARGNLGSYPPEEIVARAQQAFAEGVKEIWMTSEDTGAWGIDLGLAIPDLLRELVKVIPEDCMLRIGMTNPPYILNHLDAIADILNHPQVYAFLHIPVQAGSDQVLVDMKREYSSAEFQRVVDVITEKVPGATIATDIICGFPTETPKDFEDTMELCRKNKFKALYINQFYARKGTPAFNMPRIDTRDVKKRTKALTDLFNSYLPYERRIGEMYDVLVTEISHDKLHYVGHNKFYEQILVPQIEGLMGQWTRVKIVSYCKHSMTGEVLSYGPTKKSLIVLPWYRQQWVKESSKFFLIFFLATVLFLKLLMVFT
jgi:threonylcarbamoyladenosine tRNA methylthiotransferase CDKAL1